MKQQQEENSPNLGAQFLAFLWDGREEDLSLFEIRDKGKFQVKECREWIVSFLAHAPEPVKFDFDFIKDMSRKIS